MTIHVGITSVLRRYCVGALAACLLAGCSASAPGLRDSDAMLAGTTRFDAARFAGDWVARVCLGPCAASVRFSVTPAGAVLVSDADGERAYRQDGPGILRALDGGEVLVVMWVDEGFRTAAIGTASGDRAAIVSRERAGGADRVEAARQVLEFNGWDIGKLRDVKA